MTDADTRLMDDYRAVLASIDVQFLRRNTFGVEFPRAQVAPLSAFVETWGRGGKLFLEPRLRDAMLAARTQASHFLGLLVPEPRYGPFEPPSSPDLINIRYAFDHHDLSDESRARRGELSRSGNILAEALEVVERLSRQRLPRLTPAACRSAMELLGWSYLATPAQYAYVPADRLFAFEQKGEPLARDEEDRLIDTFRRYAVVIAEGSPVARKVRVRLSGDVIDQGWQVYYVEDSPDGWRNEVSRLRSRHNFWETRVEFDV